MTLLSRPQPRALPRLSAAALVAAGCAAHFNAHATDFRSTDIDPDGYPPTLPPGFSGEPWAADLHLTPDGRFLYSSERRSSTLAAFRVDPHDGTLAPLGHTPTEAQPRSFAITPDGCFLIVAGQVSNRLAVHAIDAGSGALRLGGVFDTGEAPGWVEVLAL